MSRVHVLLGCVFLCVCRRAVYLFLYAVGVCIFNMNIKRLCSLVLSIIKIKRTHCSLSQKVFLLTFRSGTSVSFD